MRSKVLRNHIFEKTSGVGQQTCIQHHDPTFKSKHAGGQRFKKKKKRKKK